MGEKSYLKAYLDLGENGKKSYYFYLLKTWAWHFLIFLGFVVLVKTIESGLDSNFQINISLIAGIFIGSATRASISAERLCHLLPFVDREAIKEKVKQTP
ncbi:hypothetical protein [uncultured Pseudoteredinibacter sp.]|uniref:hypothetical protein n=1 Tax=uncultured Pseudoteredinibacter sp. TaxID=1641701 RepID=UPI00262015CD|nr:hypothetical protein [uncultured Pseudoteredinibacter sp.]